MPYGGYLPFGKWPLAGLYARLMMENGLLYWLLQDGGKSYCKRFSWGACAGINEWQALLALLFHLFHRNAFGQVAGLVHIGASGAGGVVSQ